MTVEGRKAHKELIESNNQRLERDVMRYKEREKHQERIQILQKKRPWAVSCFSDWNCSIFFLMKLRNETLFRALS